MTKTRAELEALRDQVLALKPAERLRFAAELIDRGRHDLAEPIVRTVADELAALRMLTGDVGTR